MIIGSRDLFGFQRLVYHPRSDTSASTLLGLLQSSGQAAGSPDRLAIRGFLSGQRLTDRTVLQEVLAVPPGHSLIRSPQGLTVQAMPAPSTPAWGLDAALRAALQRTLDSGKRVALALSGGLDSALLLALLRELGASHVPVYILATGMPNYCERDAAVEMAARLHATIRFVEVDASNFVSALPRTVQHVEEPMFNLHPVAKLLLAEAMAEDGIEIAITGDGADQVMRRDQSANYLPLCKALFDAASVTLSSPFLDHAVVRYLTRIPADPDKQCLRVLADQLHLPERLVRGPKQSRLAPAMDLESLLKRDHVQSLAAALDIPAPLLVTDNERMLWTTLCMTLDRLGATITPTMTPP